MITNCRLQGYFSPSFPKNNWVRQLNPSGPIFRSMKCIYWSAKFLCFHLAFVCCPGAQQAIWTSDHWMGCSGLQYVAAWLFHVASSLGLRSSPSAGSSLPWHWWTNSQLHLEVEFQSQSHHNSCDSAGCQAQLHCMTTFEQESGRAQEPRREKAGIESVFP